MKSAERDMGVTATKHTNLWNKIITTKNIISRDQTCVVNYSIKEIEETSLSLG